MNYNVELLQVGAKKKACAQHIWAAVMCLDRVGTTGVLLH